MSIEQVDQNTEPPLSHVQEPKSSGKKWLLGGCGCLGFIALLCIGGVALFYMQVVGPMQSLIQENIELATVSQDVADAVGEPVEVGREPTQMMPRTWQEDGVAYQEMRFPVTGSKAKGELLLTLRQTGAMSFEKDSLKLELEDGTMIDLDPDAELQLDIDMGD